MYLLLLVHCLLTGFQSRVLVYFHLQCTMSNKQGVLVESHQWNPTRIVQGHMLFSIFINYLGKMMNCSVSVLMVVI